jgi:hypothetical protein
MKKEITLIVLICISLSTINAQQKKSINENRLAAERGNLKTENGVLKKLPCACGVEIYGKDAAACERICQFLKDGTNSNARFSSNDLKEIKEDYLNGLMITENGISKLKPELFKEVKTKEDWKDKKVSISKGDKKYVFLGNQDDLIKIISIQNMEVVKECTNCTTVTCNGTTYTCTCVNGFCMCVLCIEIEPMSDNPFFVAPIDNNTGAPAQPIFDGFVAGEPIGGIIVKGGRNPGGSLLTVTTNTKGEFEFEVKDRGDYLFVLTASPELEATARRAAKKAAKQTISSKENPLYNSPGTVGSNPIYNGFVAGGPIGGIVVKGGKNPGGSLLTISTNPKGHLAFKDLVPGIYKFVITTPKGDKGITENGIK